MFEKNFHSANTAPATLLLDEHMHPMCKATVNAAQHA